MGVFGRWGRVQLDGIEFLKVKRKEIAFVILGELVLSPLVSARGLCLVLQSSGMHTRITSPSSPNVPQASSTLFHVREASLVPGRHNAVEHLARPDHGSVGPVNCRLRQMLGPHDTASDIVDSLEKLINSLSVLAIQATTTYRFEVLGLLDRALEAALHVRHHTLCLLEYLETSRATELDFGVHLQQMLLDTFVVGKGSGVASRERTAVHLVIQEQVCRVLLALWIPPTSVQQEIGRLALLFVAFLEDGLGLFGLRQRDDIAEESAGALLGGPGRCSHQDAFSFGGGSR